MISKKTAFLLCFFLFTSPNLFGQSINNGFSDNSYNSNAFNKDNRDSLGVLKGTTFFSNSHLLFGAEILDPLKPKDFFTRATRLWKTDIRFGISQPIGDDIKAVFSIRDEDSPQTNNINLYETFVKINHEWGNLFFGQRRVQAGNNSQYIYSAFDRPFWDKGLIYDFIMRGLEVSKAFNNSNVNLFIGSELSAAFIGGGKFSIQPFHWLNAQASALYIARDPQYAAFGVQFGLELSESSEILNAYHVFGYKTFDQEPARVKELTLFNEIRYQLLEKFNIGGAVLFRRLFIKPYQDELRLSIDAQYQLTNFFTPIFQIEHFNILNYTETQIGIAAMFNYYNCVKIIPRIRYINTQFGPDIGFIGIEGRIEFGRESYQ